jgi:hypothetical protein
VLKLHTGFSGGPTSARRTSNLKARSGRSESTQARDNAKRRTSEEDRRGGQCRGRTSEEEVEEDEPLEVEDEEDGSWKALEQE